MNASGAAASLFVGVTTVGVKKLSPVIVSVPLIGSKMFWITCPLQSYPSSYHDNHKYGICADRILPSVAAITTRGTVQHLPRTTCVMFNKKKE